ncbi:MAG: TPM domain-containing protein [Burkholderiales bacterium]|nr:TPM domain-containing protein [Burkholderiales bacterium]
MKIQRILRHLLTTSGDVARAFPVSTLNVIEAAIEASEAQHAGEVRFVVEGALDGTPLFKEQSPKDRAMEVFGRLRVWDTEHNNGLLIYLLLADRAVEIVADRGIHAKVGADAWRQVCWRMETAFKQSNFEAGVVEGVQAVTQHLVQHFPADVGVNELPDRPVLL